MKKSLSLGLNEVDPRFYNNWNGWLAACVNDARDIAVLCARAGFESKAVFNLECTVERFRTEVASAAAGLVAGDTFLLSYSGHGGRAPSWAFSGYTETLCLADGQLADTALREMLAKFAYGVRVVVLFDSCHSGGLSRTIPAHRGKPAFVKSAVAVPVAEPIPVPASVLMISGCEASEVAMDGEVNGAFTASLLTVADTVSAGGTLLTWDSWASDTQRYMAKWHPSQHPVVEHYGSAADWGVGVSV